MEANVASHGVSSAQVGWQVEASFFGWPEGSNSDRFWEGSVCVNGAMLGPKILPNMDVILEWPLPRITQET